MNPATLVAILSALGPLLQSIPQLGSIVGGLVGTQAAPTSANAATQLLQEGLNALQAQGVVQFGPPLVEDGIFGGRTFGAIKALQAKFGFAVQEPLASIEMQLLSLVLSRL